MKEFIIDKYNASSNADLIVSQIKIFQK